MDIHVHTTTPAGEKRSEGRMETSMVHYQCHTCGMAATLVVSEQSSLAWLDHMDTHGAKENFSAWTWTVKQLEGWDEAIR